MIKRLSLILSLVLLSQTISAHSIQEQNSLSEQITKDKNGVVSILVQSEINQPFQEGQNNKDHTSLGLGSGVIMDANKGYIITNAHVVNNGKIIIVRLKDGRRYVGHLVGEDTGFDIAVVKINAKNLTQLEFADSDNLKVGEQVAAIGSPFGLDQTVTSGIVSALNVSHPKIEGFQSFIQTDAPINPGNSGGPLINEKGQVEGINTAILGPGGNIGIGFSIPINMVKSIADQLIQYGHVERGALGVIAQTLNPQLNKALNISPKTQGTLVSEVIPGSPADKAGLKTKDVVLQIDNKSIKSSDQLRNMLGLMRPGTNLTIKVQRNGTSKTFTAKVGSPSALMPPQTLPFIAGENFQNFNEIDGTGKRINGAIITKMEPTSPGALAGLLPGDVIIKAANKPVNNVNALETIVKNNKNKQQLLVLIKRGGMNAYMVVPKS